jgi:predicted dehydrogenase
MPEPKPDDARWSLALAGGALMDLGCYALQCTATWPASPAVTPPS